MGGKATRGIEEEETEARRLGRRRALDETVVLEHHVFHVLLVGDGDERVEILSRELVLDAEVDGSEETGRRQRGEAGGELREAHGSVDADDLGLPAEVGEAVVVRAGMDLTPVAAHEFHASPRGRVCGEPAAIRRGRRRSLLPHGGRWRGVLAVAGRKRRGGGVAGPVRVAASTSAAVVDLGLLRGHDGRGAGRSDGAADLASRVGSFWLGFFQKAPEGGGLQRREIFAGTTTYELRSARRRCARGDVGQTWEMQCELCSQKLILSFAPPPEEC